MNLVGPTHYRFYDTCYENYYEICLETFEVVKETPAGYWVVPTTAFKIGEWYWKDKRKFVLKSSWKRYCYPTLLEAMNSYYLRKYRQVPWAKSRLSKSQRGLAYADVMRGESEAKLRELFLGLCDQPLAREI